MYVCMHVWRLCMFVWGIHTYTLRRLRHTYTLDGFKHTYNHTRGPSKLKSDSVGLTKTLTGRGFLNLCFIIPSRTIRKNHDRERFFAVVPNKPLEAPKIKFWPGSPECYKTLSEIKVWTHFLVQAGYLFFCLPKPPIRKSMYGCMYVCLRHTYVHAWGLQTYVHTRSWAPKT